MNSSKPVLILGKGITGESFRKYFSSNNQPFITFDTRIEKKDFNLNENKDFYSEKINTAKFFYDKIIPRIDSHYNSAKSGSDNIMKANFN